MTESKLESSSPVPKFKSKDVVDLLPIFDSSKPNCLTINQWISKVETVSDSYRWDDGTTLIQTVSKLKGAVRVWYEATTVNLTTWAKLSREIISAFPNGRDESDIHLELTMKRKTKEETLEEYFYDMMAISKKVPISDQALMKYIITGIGDVELTKMLVLSEYADPQQLLRRYEDTMCQARHRKELQTREVHKSADTKPNLPRTPKAASTPLAKGRLDTNARFLSRGLNRESLILELNRCLDETNCESRFNSRFVLIRR